MNFDYLIELENVDMVYRKAGKPFPVLENLNLKVKRGDFISIVGPTNCGKTVLLRLIAGFEKPTRGKVLFEGRPIKGPNYKRGFIFQEVMLFPWLTVYENASFGLRIRGVAKKEIEEITTKWLNRLGLGKFQNRFIRELSGGMQQRLGFARVMVNDPDILLCDEPFGNLDWVTRETLSNELVQLWYETKKTIIYVTHAIEEAVFLSQKVYIMSNRPGKIVERIEINLPEKRWEDKGLRFRQNYMRYVETVRNLVVKQGQKIGVI